MARRNNRSTGDSATTANLGFEAKRWAVARRHVRAVLFDANQQPRVNFRFHPAPSSCTDAHRGRPRNLFDVLHLLAPSRPMGLIHLVLDPFWLRVATTLATQLMAAQFAPNSSRSAAADSGSDWRSSSEM